MNKIGNLIRLLDLDNDFIIELKYFSKENFTKQKIYNSNECYLDENTAQRLIRAKNIFKKDGYRVKIWDAYRPIRAQKKFWDIFPNNNYVAMPPDMSKNIVFKNSHMNGQCVDLTLTNLEGEEIPMPSSFDEFSKSSRLDCPYTDEHLLANGKYLRNVMESVGFSSYENEWWHFYDHNVLPAPYSDFDI